MLTAVSDGHRPAAICTVLTNLEAVREVMCDSVAMVMATKLPINGYGVLYYEPL